jgi:hypothetical protein
VLYKYQENRRLKTLVKVFVLRHDKGKSPPSALTDEVKKQLGGALEKYYKENPGVKFNGLWVNEEGVGVCQWDSPDTESVKRFFDSIGEAYDEIVAVEKVL